MNENVELKNKEIIALAMRKCKKIGKSIIVPDAVFNKTNSSNIKEDNKIKEKNTIWKSCTSWNRKWKIKKESWTIRRKNWRT